MILVSEADIFLSESLRILAERLSQSEIGLPLKQICYYSPPKEVEVFSTEIIFKLYKAIFHILRTKKHVQELLLNVLLILFYLVFVPSKLHTKFFSSILFSYHLFWLCPRPISNSQLHVLPLFHLCPIYLVVFKGSY